jgi:hypothetical protein
MCRQNERKTTPHLVDLGNWETWQGANEGQPGDAILENRIHEIRLHFREWGRENWVEKNSECKQFNEKYFQKPRTTQNRTASANSTKTLHENKVAF